MLHLGQFNLELFEFKLVLNETLSLSLGFYSLKLKLLDARLVVLAILVYQGMSVEVGSTLVDVLVRVDLTNELSLI